MSTSSEDEDRSSDRRRGRDQSLPKRRSYTERGGSYSDPLFLSNSNHPGTQLVSNPFNGSNYHSWNHNVRVALGSKKKLGFITGLCVKPAKDSDDFDRWERCDFMVMSWLTNSMVSEIADNFLHVTSAKELWDEVTERFAESNQPLIFQLQKQLVSIKQENLTIAMYYSKLKKVWDELQAIDSLLLCECGAIETCTCVLLKRLLDRESSLKMMQFLMGLSDAYENLRCNILSQEPLPIVNKAFHMALQVERQKGITMPSLTPHDVLAVNRSGYNSHRQGSTPSQGGGASGFGQGNGSGFGGSSGRSDRRDYKRTKLDRKCDFCQESGHLKEGCFKLIGYPDWWKGPRSQGQGSSSGKLMANVQDVSMFGNPLEQDDQENRKPDSSLINAVVQEVMKAFQGRFPSDEAASSGQPHSTSFSGMFHTLNSLGDIHAWSLYLDSGFRCD